MKLIRKLLLACPAVVRWTIMSLYLIAVIYASLSPTEKIPKLLFFPHIDIVAHFLMYFLFCMLGIWTIDKRKIIDGTLNETVKKQFRNYLIIFVLAVIWGFSMEIFQRAMHLGREYSLVDMLANITGAIVGTGLYHVLFSQRKLKNL